MVRFGSYSMVLTVAGTPSLRRLKSMRRYMRREPPPRWYAVMRPLLFRPPRFCRGSSRDFLRLLGGDLLEGGTHRVARAGGNGSEIFQRHGFSSRCRRAAVCLQAFDKVDAIADLQRDHGLFGIGLFLETRAVPLALAAVAGDVDADDRDVEVFFHRLLDQRLVGPGSDFEGVLPSSCNRVLFSVMVGRRRTSLMCIIPPPRWPPDGPDTGAPGKVPRCGE